MEGAGDELESHSLAAASIPPCNRQSSIGQTGAKPSFACSKSQFLRAPERCDPRNARVYCGGPTGGVGSAGPLRARMTIGRENSVERREPAAAGGDYDRARLQQMLANEADMAFKRRAQAIYDFLEIEEGDRVLDLGCGRGFFMNLTSTIFPGCDLLGVELDPSLLAVARRRVARARVVSANAYHLPFPDNSFDKVIFTEVLEHIPDDAAAMDEVVRVMAPGALLALTTPHDNYPLLWDPINKILETLTGRHIQTGPLAGIWANHVRLYSVEGLAGLAARSGLVVEDARFITHYCFPFIHNLVYGIGKPLLERGALPDSLAEAADRFDLESSGGAGLNPIRIGVAAFNAVDRLNDLDPPTADRSFLIIALKARKPEDVQ